MDRLPELLKFISKTDKGIEVAPGFSPIAPRCEGYNCVSLDFFNTEQLIARGAADPTLPAGWLERIEPVNFVGNAVDIADILAVDNELHSFDYVVSSHNFEHLPNPIGFLQGCQKILKPGGVVTMAIPDMRATFDHFRPRTVIGDWLEAYFENRTRPTPSQIFSQHVYSCKLLNPPGRETAFMLDDDPAMIFPNERLEEGFAGWCHQREHQNTEYIDTHCSVGTMRSFQLLILECRYLGLIELAVKRIAGPNGCEFFLHLERAERPTDHASFRAAFYKERRILLHQIEDELAKSSLWGWSQLRHQSTVGQPTTILEDLAV